MTTEYELPSTILLPGLSEVFDGAYNFVVNEVPKGTYNLAASWPGILVWGVSKVAGLLHLSPVKSLVDMSERQVKHVDAAVSHKLMGDKTEISIGKGLAAGVVLSAAAEMGVRFLVKAPKTLIGGVSKKEEFSDMDWVVTKSYREKSPLKSRMAKSGLEVVMAAAFTGIAGLIYKGWSDKVVSEGHDSAAAVILIPCALDILLHLGKNFKITRNKAKGPLLPVWQDREFSVSQYNQAPAA